MTNIHNPKIEVYFDHLREGGGLPTTEQLPTKNSSQPPQVLYGTEVLQGLDVLRVNERVAVDASDMLQYLLPTEHIVGAYRVPTRVPKHPVSGIQALKELTGSETISDIGRVGPVLAAKALSSEVTIDSSNTPEELLKYEAVFGRDSLISALFLNGGYPALTFSTLKTLATNQGLRHDLHREESPGAIPHEIRHPESKIAQELTAERGWGWPYYGTIDATPLFIQLMAMYAQIPAQRQALHESYYTDKDGQEQPLIHSAHQAVNWLTNRLDQNPEGLLEYKCPRPGGLENQVWKDSWDSYSHADGSIANQEDGIASIEVQALAYDALLDAAELFDDQQLSGELLERAQNLRDQIIDKFWTNEKGGYFVLGTDRDQNGNLRQLKVRTSNMGHVLRSRLLAGSDPQLVTMRESVIKQLFSSEMLNVSGIRTLAADEARFKPGAYHNGNVWLWDTYYIARGLREHGYGALASNLEARIINVIKTTGLMPEYARGGFEDTPTLNARVIDAFDSQYGKLNRIEQPPQEIQAWTVASSLAIKMISRLDSVKKHHPTAFESQILATL